MTSLTDRSIAALRSLHDDLSSLAANLGTEQLAGPSGSAEWPISQVFSHLGSGAEITQATYASAVNGTPAPEGDFNQSVWDRWNAMTPAEHAAGFVTADAALVEWLESLTPEQREGSEVKYGFLPMALPLGSALGMRLSEVSQHAWDIQVGSDPAATLDATAADLMVEQFTGGLGFLLGFTGKADQVSEPAVVNVPDAAASITIGDSVALTPLSEAPTATLSAAPEALIRLIGGRLTAAYTPTSLTTTGNITLDDLRKVFPGY